MLCRIPRVSTSDDRDANPCRSPGPRSDETSACAFDPSRYGMCGLDKLHRSAGFWWAWGAPETAEWGGAVAAGWHPVLGGKRKGGGCCAAGGPPGKYSLGQCQLLA